MIEQNVKAMLDYTRRLQSWNIYVRGLEQCEILRQCIGNGIVRQTGPVEAHTLDSHALRGEEFRNLKIHPLNALYEQQFILLYPIPGAVIRPDIPALVLHAKGIGTCRYTYSEYKLQLELPEEGRDNLPELFNKVYFQDARYKIEQGYVDEIIFKEKPPYVDQHCYMISNLIKKSITSSLDRFPVDGDKLDKLLLALKEHDKLCKMFL
jgi:hypothetical protein